MREFATLTMLFSIVVTISLGARMLWVARRTRGLPEFLFGMAFVCLGLGQGAGQLGQKMLWNEPGLLATTMGTACFGLVVIAFSCLYIVVWRVFRANGQVGGVIAGLGIGLLLIGYGVRIWSGDFVDGAKFGAGMRIVMFARVSIFVWISMEAIHHSAQLYKRARLGLGDVMPAHQIRMWAVTGAANVVLTILISWYLIELRRDPLQDFWMICVVLTIVVTSVTSMWLAFFPPARLSSWLRTRFAQGMQASGA